MMKKLKEEAEKNALNLSVTESGKEGKRKMIASSDFLEDELRQHSKAEGVTFGRQRENAWSGSENKSQEVGSKRKSEEEEVESEILAHQEEYSLPEEPCEGGGQETLTCRNDASKDSGCPCSGDVSYGEVKIEKTHGSSSVYNLPVLVYGSIRLLSGRGALHHGYSVLGRWSMDRKMESRAKRSMYETDSRGSNVKASERTCRSSDV